MSLEQAQALMDAMRARRSAAPPPDLMARRRGFETQFAALPRDPECTTRPAEPEIGMPGLWVEHRDIERGHALVWLHGGAFVLGSSASYRAMGEALSRAAGASVLLPDYPLAPEHRYPVARDTVLSALTAISARYERLALGGDSAGGNLALSAAQHPAAPALSALWLVSPYLDLTHSGASIVSRASRDAFIDTAGMPATAATYLGDADPADPGASPLFGPLDRLPPTLIQVGSEEVLFDDAWRLALGAPSACFQQWAGMPHVWPLFGHMIEEGRWAIAQGGAFLRQCWTRG
jgi:monoterpene epsilon-lactone hydrolase